MKEKNAYIFNLRKHKWFSLFILTLPVLLVAVDATVLHFAVPKLSKDLKPSSNQLLWIIDIYSFVIASFLVTMGFLGDRIGRKKILLYGSGLFSFASILAAYSVNSKMLIFSRIILGISGATLMPSTLSLIRTIFINPNQRRLAIAIWSSVASFGAAAGPIIGGILLEKFWWGSVFLINIPIMILFLILGSIFIEESKDYSSNRFDLISAFLSLISIILIIYSIKSITSNKINFFYFMIIFFSGIILTFIFIKRQKKITSPMLDISLFKKLSFVVSILINMISIFALVGAFFIIAQYLQVIIKLKPIEAALWLIPATLAEAIGAFAAVKIAKKMKLNESLSLGILLCSIGFVISVTIGPHISSLLSISFGFVVLGLGSGISYTLSNDNIMNSVRPEKSGRAAAISETAYEFGAALSIALLGSLLNIKYRSSLNIIDNNNIKDYLKIQTLHQSSFGEAITLLSENNENDSISQIITNVFVQSMQFVGLITFIFLLFTSIITYVYMKKRI